MCHGTDGRGQSAVAAQFARAGAVPPIDLASPRVRARTDGQLNWLVANGLGNMPPYGDLLSETELWAVVLFIREVQAP
jgi:mono/diheme cytochrome c family protein